MLIKSIFGLTLKSSINRVECTNLFLRQPILKLEFFYLVGVNGEKLPVVLCNMIFVFSQVCKYFRFNSLIYNI